jgi:hypothetical protein
MRLTQVLIIKKVAKKLHRQDAWYSTVLQKGGRGKDVYPAQYEMYIHSLGCKEGKSVLYSPMWQTVFITCDQCLAVSMH